MRFTATQKWPIALFSLAATRNLQIFNNPVYNGKNLFSLHYFSDNPALHHVTQFVVVEKCIHLISMESKFICESDLTEFNNNYTGCLQGRPCLGFGRVSFFPSS